MVLEFLLAVGSAILAAIKWPALRMGQAMGVTNKPYILLGNPTLVALPDDPRPGYESWWHLECINRQRGKLAARIHTHDAERCRVRILFKPLYDSTPEITDDGVFLIGTSQPPSEEATLPVNRAMPIPLYMQVPKGTPHPISGQPLKGGTYVTGAQFLYQPALVDRQLLTGGTYEVTVSVSCDRKIFTKRLSIQARVPFTAPTVPTVALPPSLPVKRSEVVSDNVRWRHTGNTYQGGNPESEALCPEASFAIRLMVKTPFGDELKDINGSDTYQVGVYSATHRKYVLCCPGLDDHQEHEIEFERSSTWVEAKAVAKVKLKAQIERDRTPTGR
jgi:hypothetical protein